MIRGSLPFNPLPRLKAGMAPEMYEPLADEAKQG